MSTAKYELPADMVEAVAEVISIEATGHFHFSGSDVRDQYREVARRALTVALAACEVREEWGCHVNDATTRWYGGKGGEDQAVRDSQFRQARGFTYPGEVSRHLVITTAPQPIADAVGDRDVAAPREECRS